VMVDDEEAADVDIMEITDPRRPRLISETDLNTLGVQQTALDGRPRVPSMPAGGCRHDE